MPVFVICQLKTDKDTKWLVIYKLESFFTLIIFMLPDFE